MTERNASRRPPRELSAGGRKLWKSLVDEYEFTVHESALLLQACRVVDILDRLAAESAGAALTVENSRGDVIANPLLVEARQQGIVLARLLAALRVPTGESEVEGRPQRRSGARGVYSPRKYGNANVRVVS